MKINVVGSSRQKRMASGNMMKSDKDLEKMVDKCQSLDEVKDLLKEAMKDLAALRYNSKNKI